MKRAFSQIGTILFWCKKNVHSYDRKNFDWKSPIRVRYLIFFFSTKVWTTKSENLVLCDHLTKIDNFGAVQNLRSFLKFFGLIFSLSPKLRHAIEISDQKILIFEKFKFPTFTGKKNQAFWTRIDNFRNSFKTLAYLDVTWSVSLIGSQLAA